ncbi:hypothetical protein HN604_03000 [archaeon]|jgi:hypothetical protein|nr:hypothetical protein [archaeon]MBT6183037.1 hypothetical protein [archaeon]MBT6606496.1 hypothetical protein [archaeon]MBT7251339.1 hypothetical protein [archaeon]MBT7661026.1 hypothetical protein [archaeon]
MVNININVGKKEAVFLALFIGAIAGAFGVIAFGGSNPTTFGHDAGELDLSGGIEGEAVFNNAVTINVEPLSKLKFTSSGMGSGYGYMVSPIFGGISELRFGIDNGDFFNPFQNEIKFYEGNAQGSVWVSTPLRLAGIA